jgi:hypothetical protein
MLSEWTKLLEKAEKTSNPNEIPVSDIEQHIRLKRKLNESLGSLARIAQAHGNRSKMSRTETSKAGRVRTIWNELLFANLKFVVIVVCSHKIRCRRE